MAPVAITIASVSSQLLKKLKVSVQQFGLC